MMALLGVSAILPAIFILAKALLFEASPSVADWAYIALLGLIGGTALMLSLRPVELQADESGLRWRTPMHRRDFAWSQIEAIGISRKPQRDLASAIDPRMATIKAMPALGVNLRIADRDPATVSYLRGLSGYDHNLRWVFDERLQAVVDDLELRRERALETSPRPENPQIDLMT